jgi:hypothetical protein
MLGRARLSGARRRRQARRGALCRGVSSPTDAASNVVLVRYGEVWEVHVAGVVVSWSADRTAAEREATRHAWGSHRGTCG